MNSNPSQVNTQSLQHLLVQTAQTSTPIDAMAATAHAIREHVPSAIIFYIAASEYATAADVLYIDSPVHIDKATIQRVQEELREYVNALPIDHQHRVTMLDQLTDGMYYHWSDESSTSEVVVSADDVRGSTIPFAPGGAGTIYGVLYIASLEELSDADEVMVREFVEAAAYQFHTTQQLLQTEQSRLAAVVRGMTKGVVVFDSEYGVVTINPALTRMTGLSREGCSMEQLYALFSGTDLEASVAQMLETGREVRIDEAHLARSILEITVMPIFNLDQENLGGAIIFSDITEQVQEEQFRTEFISLASHQLRTPLTAMNWFLEMLLDNQSGDLNETQREFVSEVYQSSQRMSELVRDLLNVTRLESGRVKVEPVAIDLEQIIHDAIGEVGPLAKEKGIEIDFTVDGDIPKSVPIDKVLLHQVVHNLLTNAIKYTDTEAGEPIQVQLYPSVRGARSFITVTVRDHGMGIPEEQQHRIFQKFFRAHNAAKAVAEGTGLGLYLAHLIMNMVDGEIWFDSKVGEGTIFYVDIPVEGMKPQEGEKGLAA